MRRTLAKRANQRLVRLERSTSPISGKAYHVGAYDIAQAELGERTRFSEKLNLYNDKTELKKEIGQLQAFLNAKSSTIAGNREIERKRIETLTSLGRSAEGKKIIPERLATSSDFYDFISSKAYIYLSEKQQDSDALQDIYDFYTEEDRLTGAEVQQIIDDYYNEVSLDENKELSFREIAERLDAMVIEKRKDEDNENS